MFGSFLQANLDKGDPFPSALARALRAEEVRFCMNLTCFESAKIQKFVSVDDYKVYFLPGIEAPLIGIVLGFLASIRGNEVALAEAKKISSDLLRQKLTGLLEILRNSIRADNSGRSVFPVAMSLINNDWYTTGVNASWMNYASMLDVLLKR